jgi:hypothetical protein
VPIIIRCHSCGFVLAVIRREDIRYGLSIDKILRQWGYRCPVCLSPLSKTPIRWEVR